MTAVILDGKKLATSIRQELRARISLLNITPKLAVIFAGDDAASAIYVRAKEKACAETGIETQTFRLAEDISAEELCELINILNTSPEINGILVQLPLPGHLNEKEILQSVVPEKDVDGFHPLNAGNVIQQRTGAFLPCTPKGIIRLLHLVRKDLSGLHAVVIGRSQIVGLPTAHLLLNENCTVTVTHSRTQNLPEICRSADILVAAAGNPEFITGEYIKQGAIVIDVGINRTPDGLKGDVCFADAAERASYITPVPGGVGPMTIAMLLENTLEAYLKQRKP